MLCIYYKIGRMVIHMLGSNWLKKEIKGLYTYPLQKYCSKLSEKEHSIIIRIRKITNIIFELKFFNYFILRNKIKFYLVK